MSQTGEGIKAILANPVMMKAYREGIPGNGKPFPGGSAIVKIEWSKKKNPVSPYFCGGAGHNGEEEAVHLTNVVPFLVEDELKRIGGHYEKAPDWESFAIVDGRVITGQNPASSTAAAKALLTVVAGKAA